MKPKHQRLAFVALSVLLLCGATVFVMQAFRDNLIFFYSPSDAQNAQLSPEKKIRVGGLVETGSLKHLEKDTVEFIITDGQTTLFVRYSGMLPALFREGQGVVAEGHLQDKQHFTATNILAKHDETYMPQEVVDALKRSGHWHDR